jgi:hypothetical protein
MTLNNKVIGASSSRRFVNAATNKKPLQPGFGSRGLRGTWPVKQIAVSLHLPCYSSALCASSWQASGNLNLLAN